MFALLYTVKKKWFAHAFISKVSGAGFSKSIIVAMLLASVLSTGLTVLIHGIFAQGNANSRTICSIH
jgi:hypothetical protein